MARVLVIDDDTDNRRFLQHVLQVATHDVHTARDGQDALAWLRTQSFPPDCIVLDLDMPIMTGQELFSRLQADPQFCHIGIIILSGDLDRHVSHLPRSAVCLEKPAPPEVLVDAVARCVGSLGPDSAANTRTSRPGH